MSQKEHYIIGPGEAGCRLDKSLHACFPDFSLRLRRRLCDDGRVLVDGTPRKPGYKLNMGQEIVVVEGTVEVTPEELGVQRVARGESFATVSKPGGVHSAAIAGRDEPSVETVLPELFPDDEPHLLNRLDNLTSGLLLVGLDPQAWALYRKYETQGRIMKFYLARVKGRMDGTAIVKNRLDTADRKTTRVLVEDDLDDCRWTFVTSLAHDRSQDTTLVRCLILKGARHQIRAHLASLDHPIIGDPLYGDGEGDTLFLHHYRIELPGFSAEITPLF